VLIVALGAAGIIHRQLVPEGTILNSLYYLGVTKRLYARMLSVRISCYEKKIMDALV
jgi:hypothetical protein